MIGAITSALFAAKAALIAPTAIDLLIVAGGGAGGADEGGAGGAGGYRLLLANSISAGVAYTATIGAGGAASSPSTRGGAGVLLFLDRDFQHYLQAAAAVAVLTPQAVVLAVLVAAEQAAELAHQQERAIREHILQ